MRGRYGACLSVGCLEGLVSCMVLVHLNSELEPRFRVCVQRAAGCHSSKGRCNLAVEPTTELDYDGLLVSVSRVVDEITELV